MPVSLISIERLSAALASSTNFTIVDARTYAEYEQGHIPGAVWLGWEDWCVKAPKELGPILQQPGYWGLFGVSSNERIAQAFTAIGITNDKPIVVYANGAASRGREGRIAWMLLYCGANDVRLLDSSYDAYVATGAAVERGSPSAARADQDELFEVKFDPRRRVMLDQLKTICEKNRLPLMLDTRTQQEHMGDLYRYMPRMGRTPNSVLMPYVDAFESNGQQFLSRDTFMRALPKPVINESEVVAYCEVGVRASTIALLYEVYTGHIMPVYDGSMMEWSSCIDLPVETKSRAPR